MGHKILHIVYLHNDELTGAGEEIRRNVASSGTLSDGPAAVESLSHDPNERQLSAQLRGETAKRRVETVEELFEAQGIDEIAFYDVEGSGEDGYYTLDANSLEVVDPRAEGVEGFTGTLTKKGTKNSHWRAVTISARQVDHEFGNSIGAHVALPAAATKPQWYDPDDNTKQTAQPAGTKATEYGEVALYDIEDRPDGFGDRYHLLYELDYQQEGQIDVDVWDDRERDPYDEDGVPQWQRVFRSDHDFGGRAIIENGLIRLLLDERDGTLEAQRWDPDAVVAVSGTGTYGSGIYGDGLYAGTRGKWRDVDLEEEQPDDVELYDVDVTSIGMVRDACQLTFDVDGDLFALNAILEAGREDVLFDIPENELGPVPEPLQEWLEPIASESIVDTQATKTLVSRSSVRR